MAAPFITVDINAEGATHARRLLGLQTSTRDLISKTEEFIAESFQMFDGDGSSSAHFELNKTKYGVGTVAQANEVFDLLNGMLAALKGTDQNAQAVAFATKVG